MELGIGLRLGILPLLLLAILSYVGVKSYLNYRKAPQFPGPFLAKISSIWLLTHTFSGKLNEYNAAILEEYGSPVRIAPDKILTNDPVILRHMSTPRSTFRRGTFYDAFSLQPPLKNVLSQKDEKLHNSLRAKLIRGYSGKDLPDLEADIDSNVATLVNLIRTESTAGRSIDFSSLAQYFTLDVLTHIAFSAPIGYLKQNRDVYSYIRTVSEFLQVLELGANSSGIQSILDSSIMAPMRPKPTDKDGMGAMMGAANKAVAERYGDNPKVEHDMLGSFVKHGLTQEEAESEAMVQVLGGSDSTATAIRMILLYVTTNPSVYVKLRKELDENAGLFEGSFITSASSRKLPYFQACVKEGLRLWPPLQALNSKVSPPGGETVNGVYIPGE
jgi:cytochrome P450